MKRLGTALEILRQRLSDKNEESLRNSEQMANEIKGSIFTLLALFELVALTSYVRIDTFNIRHGNLENVTNLAGIVGALLAEWTLGLVGVVGYGLIPLTLYLAYAAFRGLSLWNMLSSIIGSLLTFILGAITCYLLFYENFPTTSLFLGGKIGIIVGTFLNYYMNKTGALILVGGGFLITLILATNLSLGELWKTHFDPEDLKEEEEEEVPNLRPKKQALTVEPTPPKKKAKRTTNKKNKPKGKKKTKNGSPEPDADTQGTDPSQADEGTIDGEEEESNLDELELIPFTGSYEFPSSRLIKTTSGGGSKDSKSQLKKNARALCNHLLSFQVTGEVTDIAQGPVLTTYEFKPDAGVKLSKIASLQDDLGIILGTRELRIVAPIPGKTVVGIEIPRKKREVISLKEMLSSDAFRNKKLKIPIPIGKTTDGQSVYGDLTAMPHLLIAGATGSGKSVFINCLVSSLVYSMSPKDLRMILVDPKMLELNVFDGLPHLVTPVITDNAIALRALEWAVKEMEYRYQLMADVTAKNIDSYNSKMRNPLHKLPYLVVIVDELADLMLSGGEDSEVTITRLAQKARAAGIHLIIATQRPSTDVITGLIKANIPSRLSFKVPSGIDSRTVLDRGGAEQLIGNGDMLMIQPASNMRRLHGAFVTEGDLKAITKKLIGSKDYSKYYLEF